MQRSIYQPAISGEEERWVISSCHQFETSECLHSEIPLQNGGCEYDKGPPPTRGLDVLLGSQGRLSFSLDNQETSEIPPLFMGWQNLRIHMPPIWSVQCPSHFHKAFATSNGTPSFPGTKNHNLPGRYVNHAPGQGVIAAGGGEGG